MLQLSVVVAAVSLLAAALGQFGAVDGLPLYVAAAGLLAGGAIYLARDVNAFIRFFIVFYALGYLVLIALLLVQGLVPAFVSALIPPPLTAFTAAAFVLLAFGLGRIPVMRTVFALADPYFDTPHRGTFTMWPLSPFQAPERWIAFGLLGLIILINLGQVAISVRLNFWSRDWLDAIQEKNAAEFWRLLLQVWVGWVAVLIVTNIIEFLAMSAFKIRWRAWMTERLTGRWLDDGTHYRLQFNGGSVDNPDQRIQEDVRKYIDTTYSLSISLIAQISSLISFAVILWGLSANLTIPGTEQKVPGLLFWCALAYAAIGTYITHRIGRRLIQLNFQQELYEANFRFSLARLREYAEPVALLSGEKTERRRLSGAFGDVIRNFFAIVSVQKWLSAFIQLYGSSNSVVPYVIVAPFYFAGQVTLGVLNQTAGAFARVDAALSFFIDRYAVLADFKAVVDRLTTFEASIDKALDTKEQSRIERAPPTGADLVVGDLALELPNGRPIVFASEVAFLKGRRTLVSGPSGSGKSTLFRAVAGIWPFGEAAIRVPEGETIMLLPQRPYIPIGTLEAAVAYPSGAGRFDRDAIVVALKAVRLDAFVPRLDEEANWAQVLSGGEQQRLSIARALLEKPDWLLLDEATAALDEPLEQAIYAVIREHLPGTSVVSIGHRSTLIAFHDDRVIMEPREQGGFTPTRLGAAVTA